MFSSPVVTRARALAQERAWGELCLLLEGETESARASAELSVLFAEALLRTGRPLDACTRLQDALPLIARDGDKSTLRRATNLCGAAHFELGELEKALDAFRRALDLGVADQDHLLVARATNNLAVIENIRGNHEEALATYRLAIPAYQQAGSVLGLAECYHNMAITYRHTSQLSLAEEHEQRAIDFARDIGNVRLMASALVGRAEVQLMQGDARMAEATALRAADDFARLSDPARRADALRLSGVARAAAGDDAGATPLLDEAVEGARACGATLIEAECLRARAETALRRGARDLALDDGRRALDLFTRLKAERERAAVEAWLASV